MGRGEELQVKRMRSHQHPGGGGEPHTLHRNSLTPPPQAASEPTAWLFPLGALSTQAVGGHVTGVGRADPF